MAEIFTIEVRYFWPKVFQNAGGGSHADDVTTSLIRQARSRTHAAAAQKNKVFSWKMPTKYCIVHQCFNSTVKAPDKLFFYVPEDPKIRKKWMTAVRRVDALGPKTKAHCCEDHFDIETDMENYVKYRLVGGKLILKKGILPHKFKCHQENNDKPKRSAVKKKRNQIEMVIVPTEDIETHAERHQLCCGCLQSGDELALKEFNIQCELLNDILKVDSIMLCYMCKQNARKAEFFIQNVQNNQILLQNYEEENPELKQFFPPTTLTQITLPPLELSGADEEEEESCTVMSSKVKMEPMDADGELSGADEEEEESCTAMSSKVKMEPMDADEEYKEICLTEEVPSHNLQPKEEVTSEEDGCSQYSPKTERKGKRRKMNLIVPKRREITLVKKSMSASTGSYETEYTIQRVTEKQCMKERERRSQDSHYLSSVYRCADCVKGFMQKTSFDLHMKLHSLSRGDVVCEICKQRFESTMKLASHKKCHTYRYKCTKCDIYRVSHSAIRTHFAAEHTSFGSSLHKCTLCPKAFKNRVSLRKHEYVHLGHERVTCDVCQLTFISKDTLLNHILRKHPPDGVPYEYRKRHVCQHCGQAFKMPYQLKNHLNVHTETRPYYCVECDRNFKSKKNLARHLKYAAPHIFNGDLNFSCEQCEKKFNSRRHLERHTNSVHLNVKPYACDKCDKAYLNSWSLREHKSYSHEGCRKERRYPCTLCDKVFHRSSILKSHIRIHTGEKPYRCKYCPSQFAQSSQLRTHTNLVHLKLTRNGKPKSTALK